MAKRKNNRLLIIILLIVVVGLVAAVAYLVYQQEPISVSDILVNVEKKILSKPVSLFLIPLVLEKYLLQ